MSHLPSHEACRAVTIIHPYFSTYIYALPIRGEQHIAKTYITVVPLVLVYLLLYDFLIVRFYSLMYIYLLELIYKVIHTHTHTLATK